MQTGTRWTGRLIAALGLWATLSLGAMAADISDFVGKYTGSAEIIGNEGTPVMRDMSVQITEGKKGFTVAWTTATRRADGSSNVKSYSIDFAPSERDQVFSAEMQRNVFGKEVPLDPMKGEPYVWARILGDTMTVYSLFVTAEGGYEIQQFDRTLSEGGLKLDYQSVGNGEIGRQVSTFLTAE